MNFHLQTNIIIKFAINHHISAATGSGLHKGFKTYSGRYFQKTFLVRDYSADAILPKLKIIFRPPQ